VIAADTAQECDGDALQAAGGGHQLAAWRLEADGGVPDRQPIVETRSTVDRQYGHEQVAVALFVNAPVRRDVLSSWSWVVERVRERVGAAAVFGDHVPTSS
jgi:hypothetical protein